MRLPFALLRRATQQIICGVQLMFAGMPVGFAHLSVESNLHL